MWVDGGQKVGRRFSFLVSAVTEEEEEEEECSHRRRRRRMQSQKKKRKKRKKKKKKKKIDYTPVHINKPLTYVHTYIYTRSVHVGM